MKSKVLAFAAITAAVFAGAPRAEAGKIVLNNDEWTLSNAGFAQAADAGTFALNVAEWFTGGGTGNFLVYSGNFGLVESSLSTTMTGGGHSWSIVTPTVGGPGSLAGYDGVYLAGNPVPGLDLTALAAYVNGGGNVYLAGGTGAGGAASEAAYWNAFLNQFGLGFGTTYNGVGGNIPIFNDHPIFAGVGELYQDNGNDALDINALDPNGVVLVTSNEGNGLYAVYDSAVPEPGTFVLLGSGLAGIALLRRRNARRN